ncbi:unnamed protein product [Meloidogyne enterolobii]|uniref:Uncharacterized protein n=1 Tax=Meloidogyne enterolobii TaxID=390850 RepID=A0ACB1ALI5_MELEN
MIKHIQASVRSEPPTFNHFVVKEFATEYGFTPLHLAAQAGHDSHIAVVGMLLSRSTQQQHAKDWRGKMVSLLIAQGSNINVMDQNGWTGMHYATKAGHLDVVKLFVNSSADAQAETKDGKVPLCFAAANNHV